MLVVKHVTYLTLTRMRTNCGSGHLMGLSRQTPRRQTPPWGRHSPWADTSMGRHLPRQTPPGRRPLGRYCPGRHPADRHPQAYTPWADTPPRQTPRHRQTPPSTPHTPNVNRMMHTCENITLPATQSVKFIGLTSS